MTALVTVRIAALLLAASLGFPAAAQVAGPAPAARAARAELWNTEQFVVRSQILGRDMLVQVAKPLMPPKGKIPAVYLVDGNQLFAVAAMNPMLGAFAGDYAPAFFVGVGYPEQSPINWYRQRVTDLVHAADVKMDDPMLGSAKTGGGGLFQRFLVEELRPLVEARYPIDPARATLAGISLGGLFATRVLLDQPDAFETYLIGSPSLWAEPSLLERARGARLKAGTKVFVSAGGLEEEQLGLARALAAALRANPSKVAVTEWVAPDEGHNTFGPAFFARALATALPPAAAK